MDAATQRRWGDQMFALLAANTTQMADDEYVQPVADYIDPAHARRERDLLFRRTPLIVAAADDCAAVFREGNGSDLESVARHNLTGIFGPEVVEPYVLSNPADERLATGIESERP